MSQISYTVQTAKLTGTPSGGVWSQVHAFTPDEQNKKGKRGYLYTVISIKTNLEGVEALSSGKEILNRLNEQYYGNLEGSPFEALQRAISVLADESPQVDISAMVIIGDLVYIAVFGGSAAWLKRDDDCGLLVESDGKLNIISGKLKDKDRILLATADLLKILPFGTIRSVLSSDLTESTEIVNPIIKSHENSGGMAAVILSISEAESAILESTNIGLTEPTIVSQPDITQFSQPRRVSEPQIYLKNRTVEIPKKRLGILIGVVVLLALFLLGAIALISKIKTSNNNKEASQLLLELEQKTNLLGEMVVTDPKSVAGLADEISQKAQRGINLNPDKQDDFNRLISKADQYQKSIGDVSFLNDLPLFIDIKLAGEFEKGRSIATMSNKIAVVVDQTSKLLLFDAVKKSFEQVDLASKGLLVTGSSDRFYVLTDEGVEEVTINGKKSVQVIKNSDLKTIKSISAYGSNLYMLDTENSKILRYPGIEGGFGVPKNWITQESVDLSKATNIVVDGVVWLSSEDSIRRFSLGKEEDFGIRGVNQFKELYTIQTLVNSDALYILDKGAKRFYRISKSGELKKTYQASIFGETESMTVGDKKAYFLSGSKIYELGIE